MNKRSRNTRKELRQAMLRIQYQRPKRISKDVCRLNITTVAREAGLTPASIHNCYPDIAALIRAKMQASKAGGPSAAASRLKQLVISVRRLKEQLRNAEKDVARIASENAKLLSLIAELRVRLRSGKIVEFTGTKYRRLE